MYHQTESISTACAICINYKCLSPDYIACLHHPYSLTLIRNNCDQYLKYLIKRFICFYCDVFGWLCTALLGL